MQHANIPKTNVWCSKEFKLGKGITYYYIVYIKVVHYCKACLYGRLSLQGSCCRVTERDRPTGCGQGAADGLMSVGRCCERLRLNSARPLASLLHLRAKFSPSPSLTCPRSCSVCSLMLEARNPSLPHASPFHFSGLFPPSRRYVGTTVSSCHSSSP